MKRKTEQPGKTPLTRIQKFILCWLGFSCLGLAWTYEPGEPGARKYANLGAAYHEEGRIVEALEMYQAALEMYQAALEIRPHLPGALSNMAAIYMETGKTFLAETLLEEAIDYYPEFTSAYVNLSVVYQREKRYPEALVLLDKAVAINGNDFTIHINRGDVLFQLKRPCEAKKAYDRARALRMDLQLTRERALLGYNVCPTS